MTNSCFRIPMTGNVDRGQAAWRVRGRPYLVMEDNRNGTRVRTNADVFFFKSLDGGSTWIGPTRVNNDA